MRGGGGEKRRQRHAFARHGAVRQDDDVVAILHGALGKPADAVKGRFHVFRPVGHIIGDIDGGRAEGVFTYLADGANAFEVLIGENGLRDFQPHMRGGAFEVQKIWPWADEGDQRHHQLFADGIDRRIGHLREVLLEIGIKHLGPVRENRNGRVIAHGTNRLLARLRHGRHQDFQVFLRIAKGLLAVEQRHQ